MPKLNFGLLTIKGENLRINKLNLDIAEITIDGNINTLNYSDIDNINKGKNNFLGKIFK